jgi:hypothetical protein
MPALAFWPASLAPCFPVEWLLLPCVNWSFGLEETQRTSGLSLSSEFAFSGACWFEFFWNYWKCVKKSHTLRHIAAARWRCRGGIIYSFF